MILHLAYGAALAFTIFELYRYPWIARMLLELATLGAFGIALAIGAGYWTGILQ